MLMKEKELDFIETMGDLRAATASIPDDMNIFDTAGNGLCLRLCDDDDVPGKQYIEMK